MEKVVPTLTIQFESDEDLELFIKWLINDNEITSDEFMRLMKMWTSVRRPNTDEAFLEIVQGATASVS